MKTLQTFIRILAVLFMVYILLIAFGLTPNIFAKSSDSSGKRASDGGANDDTVKCEYKDANGNTITITGKGAEFERLCKQKRGDQAHYFTGYNQPYYPYRYWYYPTYGYNWYYYPSYYWGGRSVII